MKARQIGVIGGRDCSVDIWCLAYDLGRGIALRGGTLLSGGLGGVMEASAKGAKDAGGLTVGILPTYDPQTANPYVDVVMPTGMGLARNVLVVSGSESVVALAGTDGTRAEVSFALQMGKLVVGLLAWGEIPGVVCAGTVDEALKLIFPEIPEKT